MELFVGGCGQNKLEIVKSKYSDVFVYEKSDIKELTKIKFGSEVKTVIINHFHKIVKNELENKKTQDDILQEIEKLIDFSKAGGFLLVIISDEIGNGIVPAVEFERQWREITGRLLCEIAKKSERVTRIVCGLCQVIKG